MEEKSLPQLVWRSTRHRKPLKRCRYSSDWRCTFSLNTNTDELRSIEEELGMTNVDSLKINMGEDITILKNDGAWDLVPCMNTNYISL